MFLNEFFAFQLHAARIARYEGMAQLKQHMSLRIQCMFNVSIAKPLVRKQSNSTVYMS